MDNKLQILDQREVLGKEFKVYGDIDNPLFLAKDVAEWIDYSFSNKEKGIRKVSQMLSTVDEDEKVLGVTNVVTQNKQGGLRENQERWFLTEDGLYEVLMQSRKSIAKPFKKEVKKILKQIRLTGGVVIEDREEEFINNYFTSFSEDVKKAMILDLKEQNKKIKTELEEKNKIINQIETSENSLLVREVAKLASKNGIKTGEKRLYNKLREWGLIFKNSREPKQEYIERGYFEIVETVRETKGKTFTDRTTKVTGKGQIYIIKRLLKENE